jgi:hypothetical protein
VKSVVQLRKRTTDGADGTDKAEQAVPCVIFTAPFVPWIHLLIIHHGHHITSTRQNRKTYRSVLVRFFCGKVHFAPFFLAPRKNPPCNPHGIRHLQTTQKLAVYMTEVFFRLAPRLMTFVATH